MVIRERLKGYGQALEDAGLAVDPDLMLDVTLPEAAYRKKIQQLFSSSDFPTGIVASDDLIALNMSYMLSGFGLKIPADVSIIGFNNSIFAEKSQPELTSIDLHTDSLTSQTVYQLIELMEGKQTLAVKMILPHQIIERQSCKRKGH
ncbi:LacI family transcriptional regulator [Mycobacteroides abscessus subsp. abscessus]|nr:LacI family transcriptional regulator [Mycobacteroides abscessus subsp. abscessus]